MSESLFHQNQMDNVSPEKADLSTQRSGCSSVKISGDLSFVTKKWQQHRLQQNFLTGGKNLAPSYPGVAFATQRHPMATGLPHLHIKVCQRLGMKRLPLTSKAEALSTWGRELFDHVTNCCC